MQFLTLKKYPAVKIRLGSSYELGKTVLKQMHVRFIHCSVPSFQTNYAYEVQVDFSTEKHLGHRWRAVARTYWWNPTDGKSHLLYYSMTVPLPVTTSILLLGYVPVLCFGWSSIILCYEEQSSICYLSGTWAKSQSWEALYMVSNVLEEVVGGGGWGEKNKGKNELLKQIQSWELYRSYTDYLIICIQTEFNDSRKCWVSKVCKAVFESTK